MLKNEGIIIVCVSTFLILVTLVTLWRLIYNYEEIVFVEGGEPVVTEYKTAWDIFVKLVEESFDYKSPLSVFLQFLFSFLFIGINLIREGKGYVTIPGPTTTPNSVDLRKGIVDIISSVCLFIICILLVWFFLIYDQYVGVARHLVTTGFATIILILTLALTSYTLYLGIYYIEVGKGYN